MYPIFKACHLVSVVAWFAGLFYVFRLFVYHRANADDERIGPLLQTMERRLLKAIIFPASVMTLVTGGLLLSTRPDVIRQPWFAGKMTFVAILLLYQALAWKTHRDFRDGRFLLSEISCRIINEVPTIALIGAVFLVVLRP